VANDKYVGGITLLDVFYDPQKGISHIFRTFRENGVRNKTIIRYDCENAPRCKECTQIVVNQVWWRAPCATSEAAPMKETEDRPFLTGLRR
jgi:hypothetical protein